MISEKTNLQGVTQVPVVFEPIVNNSYQEVPIMIRNNTRISDVSRVDSIRNELRSIIEMRYNNYFEDNDGNHSDMFESVHQSEKLTYYPQQEAMVKARGFVDQMRVPQTTLGLVSSIERNLEALLQKDLSPIHTFLIRVFLRGINLIRAVRGYKDREIEESKEEEEKKDRISSWYFSKTPLSS